MKQTGHAITVGAAKRSEHLRLPNQDAPAIASLYTSTTNILQLLVSQAQDKISLTKYTLWTMAVVRTASALSDTGPCPRFSAGRTSEGSIAIIIEQPRESDLHQDQRLICGTRAVEASQIARAFYRELCKADSFTRTSADASIADSHVTVCRRVRLRFCGHGPFYDLRSSILRAFVLIST